MRKPSDITIRRVLDGTASARQAETVAQWFATEDGRAWLETDMSENIDSFFAERKLDKDSIPSEEMLLAINKKIDNILSLRKRRRIAYRCAAFAIPCLLIFIVWMDVNSRLGGPVRGSRENEILEAANGERKEVVFQDGTKVSLNAGTTIEYPKSFALSSRTITLDGEALFNVSPNKKRPFEVMMNGTKIRVLGTSFSVKAYKQDPSINILLIDGQVEFHADAKTYIMQPLQKLTYNKSEHTVQIVDNQNPDKETFWRKDVIYFQDAPLTEVAATLSRWYDLKFEIDDEVPDSYTFSFKTNLIPVDELLEELNVISALNFQHIGDTVRISRN